MEVLRDPALLASAGLLGLFLVGPWAWVLPLLYFLALFLGQGAVVLLAYEMPKLEPADVGEVKDPPLVSVIIPARNEREDLPRCLEDLRAQDYPEHGGRLEVLVVDDASTDGTGELARAHPLRPTVLPSAPLPPGWAGKNWACHQGFRAAQGEMLLFLDADVRLGKEAVRGAVAAQRSTGADLVSFAARVVMVSFWERVVMPLYVQFVLIYFRTPHVNRDTSRRAMANGQFLLFPREGYARAGGHERVKGAVLEDVRLAEELKRSGRKVRVFWAPQLLWTRMYAHRREMGEGILKTLHGTRFSLPRSLGLALAIFVAFLSPFVVLGLWALALLPWTWGLAATLAVGVTALKQVGFQRAVGAPLGYGLLYPVGCVYYLGLFARSLRRGLGDRSVAWKGRDIAMESGPR